MGTFYVFAGCSYYSDGGWRDFKLAINGIDNAERAAIEEVKQISKENPGHGPFWWQVVDADRLKIVREGDVEIIGGKLFSKSY
jgi:hypothetical protein